MPNAGAGYEPVDKEDQDRAEPEPEVKEVTIDLQDEAPEHHDTITVSVTDGATVIATFEYAAPPELSVRDLRAGLNVELQKVDDQKKIRLLIFRGQILRDEQCVGDTKMQPGDTLQMLTASNTPPPPPADEPVVTAPSTAGRSPRDLLMELGMLQHVNREQPVAAQISIQGMEMQEEVERWGARVKIWTCMLLLLYSFKLLVGLSQSMEQRERDQHAPNLAFDLLGFWVAYIGARAATRLNLSLARGYLYGQVVVAVCHLFLIATKDPSVTANGDTMPTSILWVSLAINCLFWGYIVYGAYRFQNALFLWLSEFHPEMILEQHSDM